MRHYNEFMDQWKRKDERYETFKRIRAQTSTDKPDGKIYKIHTPEFLKRGRSTLKKGTQSSKKDVQTSLPMERAHSSKKVSEFEENEAGIWMGHETKTPQESDSNATTPNTESSLASAAESEDGDQSNVYKAHVRKSLPFGAGVWDGFSSGEDVDVESIL